MRVYSFARIGAALTMHVEDYFPEGKRWKPRLHEKGGKEHVVPVHHALEAYLDAYIDAAGSLARRRIMRHASGWVIGSSQSQATTPNEETKPNKRK